MTRSHGRCAKGERVRMGFPHGHRKTTTLVAALRMTGMVAPMVLDGPINGDWFEAYVAPVLVPELQPGDVVIMDNLSSHKSGTGLKRPAPYCASFRPTARTSIRSRKPSLVSRPCSGKLASAGSAAGGASSANSSTSSSPPNAPIPTDRKMPNSIEMASGAPGAVQSEDELYRAIADFDVAARRVGVTNAIGPWSATLPGTEVPPQGTA